MQAVHNKTGIQIQASINSKQVLLTPTISSLGWRKCDAFGIYQRGRIDRIWQLIVCRT